MKNLNYKRLKQLKPTIYDVYTNSLGQKMEFVEHPIRGDEYPVIIMYHDTKEAFETDFFDIDDMAKLESDYEPIYQHGTMMMAFELG